MAPMLKTDINLSICEGELTYGVYLMVYSFLAGCSTKENSSSLSLRSHRRVTTFSVTSYPENNASLLSDF